MYTDTTYLSPFDKCSKLSGCEQSQVSRTNRGDITKVCETHHLVDFIVQQRLVGQYMHNTHVLSTIFPNVKTFCISNKIKYKTNYSTVFLHVVIYLLELNFWFFLLRLYEQAIHLTHIYKNVARCYPRLRKTSQVQKHNF